MQPQESQSVLEGSIVSTHRVAEKSNPLILGNRPVPEGSIVIHFEVCVNCKQKHSFCTQHNEVRYAELYHSFQEKIEATIPNAFCQVNFKTPKPSIGAFEITYQGMNINKLGFIIYSKKNTGLFPAVDVTIQRIQNFLADFEKDQTDEKKSLKKYAQSKEQKQVVNHQQKSKPSFQAYMKMKEEEFIKQEALKEEQERKRKEQEEIDRIAQEQAEELRLQKELEEKRIAEHQKAQEEEEKAAEKARQEAEAKQKAQEKENVVIPPREDAPKVEPPKSDAPKIEVPKADPPKADPPKADPPK